MTDDNSEHFVQHSREKAHTPISIVSGNFSAFKKAMDANQYAQIKAPLILINSDKSSDNELQSDAMEEFEVHDQNEHYKLSYMRKKRPLNQEANSDNHETTSRCTFEMPTVNTNPQMLNYQAPMFSAAQMD